jgi:hypothetical protein
MSLSTAQKLILAFVTLMLGVVLIGTIASNGLAVTEKTYVADETSSFATARIYGAANNIDETNASANVTVTNAPTGWKVQDCPLTSVAVGNSSTDFTLDTDYHLYASSGIVHLKNTTNWINTPGNSTYIDYRYCGDGYLNLSWGRTLLNLIGGFFAIAILLVSVGLFYSVAKDANII